MYQEKDTPPQTGVFMLVTQQMLDEYQRKETQTQPMSRLDKAMLIVTVLFVLVIVTLKLWS
jgi:hypothetical protein